MRSLINLWCQVSTNQWSVGQTKVANLLTMIFKAWWKVHLTDRQLSTSFNYRWLAIVVNNTFSRGIPSSHSWASQHVGDAYSVDLIAWRRLTGCSRNVAIHIQSDHIVRQTITKLWITRTLYLRREFQAWCSFDVKWNFKCSARGFIWCCRLQGIMQVADNVYG